MTDPSFLNFLFPYTNIFIHSFHYIDNFMSKVDILFQRSFKTLRALIIVYAIEPKTATSNKSAVRNHTMTGILSIDSE